jgi:hypothetical protein
MSEENEDALPLTSIELLDAAVWREIGSEEAQPATAFLEALSRLLGRWLLVRSYAPEMDVVTVLSKARGYIARQHQPQKLPLCDSWNLTTNTNFRCKAGEGRVCATNAELAAAFSDGH